MWNSSNSTTAKRYAAIVGIPGSCRSRTRWYRGGPWAAVVEQLSRLRDEITAVGGEVVTTDDGVRAVAGAGRPALILGVEGADRILKSQAANGSMAPLAPDLPAALRTLRALRDEEFDIVHIHEPLVPGPAMTALLMHSAPTVATGAG